MGKEAGRPVYGIHPGVTMVQNWIATLPEKTGRTLDQWVALVKAEGPPTEAARRDWLKAEHRLGTNTAWWIAERCDGKGTEEDDPAAYLKAAAEWVEEMFSGKKAALRPVYDALLGTARALGDDVRACPCKTIVPLYRRHVFGQLKPTTNTRLDLGLALGDTPASGRLIDTGGFAKKDRITHRIPVARVEEIDDELRGWLRTAYERDAGG
jgi:hypothetical protein